jgi:glucosamine-6-phosphate deaminase
MRIIIVENKEKVSLEAYNIVKNIILKNNQAVLGLATGSTPVGLYKLLIDSFKKKELSFKEVTTCNLDEYVGLDRNHPQCYYHFMKEHLFDHIDISLENTFIPNGMAEDLEKECKHYEDVLNQHQVDVQILGVGSNGHIGFNEPMTPFDSITHVIELAQQTREDNARFFDNVESVPTHAITMGISSILRAKKIVLMATSESKAMAIKRMIEGPVDPTCPASVLQTHPDVVVIVDKDAARMLGNG